MIHKYIKLVVAGLIAGFAGYQFYEEQIMNGISLLLLAGIFIFFYFRNEFILLAFWQLRSQNFKKCGKWLSYIKNPSKVLVTKQEGYFNYLLGILSSQTNITQAEKYFKKALKLGLNMKQDMAMVKLQLAGIAATKRRKREATNLLSEAKKLDKYGMLGEQIKMIKQQLKKI